MTSPNGSLEANCSVPAFPPSSSASVDGHAIASFFLLLACYPLNLTIIWYEYNVADNFRTLVNKIISVMAGYNLLLCSSAVLLVCSWTAFGPLPPSFCMANTLILSFAFVQLILAVNELNIVRFLYACHFEHVGALNEEFFQHFFIVFNAVMGAFISALAGIVAIGNSTFFCTCTGMDSACCQLSGEGVPGMVGVTVVALFNAILYLKTALKKRECDAITRPSVANDRDTSIAGQKTVKFTIAMFALSFVPSASLDILMGHGFEEEARALFPSGLLFSMYLNTVLIPGMYFARNEHMRSLVRRDLKDDVMYMVTG